MLEKPPLRVAGNPQTPPQGAHEDNYYPGPVLPQPGEGLGMGDGQKGGPVGDPGLWRPHPGQRLWTRGWGSRQSSTLQGGVLEHTTFPRGRPLTPALTPTVSSSLDLSQLPSLRGQQIGQRSHALLWDPQLP